MNPEMTTWLLFMWSVAATGLYLFFLAYLPAKALMYRLKLKLSWDTLLAIGTSMLMLVLFIGRFLLPDQILLLIYGLVSLYLAIKYKLIKIGIKKLPSPVLIVILILGVFSQSYSFLNGLVYGFPNLERLVSSLHDQAWHISLVNELLYHYPPQVPGFSGHILSNYHYFYDLLLAGQVKLTGSDTLMLVQIIYPVLVSLFFGISAYQMLGITIKNYYLKLIGLFLIYFGGSFDYILFYLGRQLAYFQPFYLDQPIVFLFNVQTTLSISLVMYALILLSNISPINAGGLLIIFLVVCTRFLAVSTDPSKNEANPLPAFPLFFN